MKVTMNIHGDFEDLHPGDIRLLDAKFNTQAIIKINAIMIMVQAHPAGHLAKMRENEWVRGCCKPPSLLGCI